MIYVMSDIHGCADKYTAMLKKINLSSRDTLYVLGDITDRGEHGIEILRDMMGRWNVVPILGNHDYMAYKVLSALNVEINEENFDTHLDYEAMRNWQEWMSNGGEPTQRKFSKLSHSVRENVLEYFEEFSYYEEISVEGKDYVLVHAGLGNFRPDKQLDDYTINELVWTRTDYKRRYFRDKILITGHTPTVHIDKSYEGKIYKGNGHIAIDCGAVFGLGLGCICLDTMEEFYV